MNTQSSKHIYPQNHNLNIHAYTIDELMNILGLSPSNITLESLKEARKRVLMVHPDKSGLSSEYFMFYKQAYETVLTYAEGISHTIKNHSTRHVNNKNYSPLYSNNENPAMQKTLSNMGSGKVNDQLNRLYEEHIASKPDTNKNSWFTQDTSPISSISKPSSNDKSMTNAFDHIRADTKTQQTMTKYAGVRELNTSASFGANFYDTAGADVDDEDETYAVCDPFSKLKFDDLRKVHRDQTIFNVSETDYDRMGRETNIQKYTASRNTSVDPLEKSRAEEILRKQQFDYEEKMKRRQMADRLQQSQMHDKMRNVEAYFLQLDNGSK